MPKPLNDAWEEFKHHWKDRAVVNHEEFYGELKHIVRDIGKLTEPKATALIKVFRDQGWRKGLGAMGKIWEMVIDWEPKSLYAGGSGKPSPLGPNYVKTPAVRKPSKIREPVVRTAPVDPRHIERLEKERREVREKETDSSRRADDEVAGLFGTGHSAYLRQARAKAKAYGLDPKKLTLGEGKHKLSYDGVGFGLKTYKDHLLWSAEEKAGRVPKGTAEKKRKAYLARATKIQGDWKQNKVSPNNLAIHILW